MSDVLISDLNPAASMAATSIIEVTTDPSGTPASEKVTGTQMATFVKSAAGLGTGDSPQFAGVNIGNATDTTITRASAGDINVEGNLVYRAGGTDVPVVDGGTGSSTASGARTNLGLVIGTNVQAWDADLDTYAGITPSANAQTLLGHTFSQMKTDLGLVIGTNVQAWDADLDTYASITPSANAQTLLGHTFSQMRTDLTLVPDTDFYAKSTADSTFQPKDSDLTTIAGLTATTNNFIQSSASAWASRTPTQATATLDAMVGDSGSGGTKGLVPAPASGDAAAVKFLKADGTWAVPAGTATAPGGSSGDLQYNNSGAFGGATWLVSTSGSFQLGAADSGSPVAQTLKVQSATGSNTAGVTCTHQGSLSTGTGAAGTRVYTAGFSSPTAFASTVTMTIATPCVVTLSAHGMITGQPIVFTTSGALPTGITSGTTYYVVNTTSTSTFNVATSVANAIAGTLVATSGTQSGTHTATTLATVQNPAVTSGTWGPSGLIGSQTTPALTVQQSWNISSGMPSVFRVNLLGIGGGSTRNPVFIVTKGPTFTSKAAIDASGNISAGGDNINGTVGAILSGQGGGVIFSNGASNGLHWTNVSTPTTNSSDDLALVKDASNIMAQRNSTNAQTSRIYRTYTDASNYERLALQSGSGYFELAAESAGTGTANMNVKITPKGTGYVALKGTGTNDSAASGEVGEYVESSIGSGSAISLTSGVAANITSISLTAGDWDVWGLVCTNPAGTTTTGYVQAGTNTTSATVPTEPTGGKLIFWTTLGAGIPYSGPIGCTRVSISSTTTIYLVINCNFSVSTMGAFGLLAARRIR